MAEGGIRSIRLALILCFVCGGLLAGASSGLKTFQEKNRNLDIQKNILKAAGIVSEEDVISEQDISRSFKQRISYIQVDKEGKILDSSFAIVPFIRGTFIDGANPGEEAMMPSILSGKF